MFELVSGFFASPFFKLAVNLLALFVIVIWFSLIYWTYRDASRRGALAIYWAAVVFFFNFPGWLVYLIVRPPEIADEVRERELDIRTKEAVLSTSDLVCSGCNRPVEKDFLICPYCMKKLKQPCTSCGRPLKMSWTVCPYCKTNV